MEDMTQLQAKPIIYKPGLLCGGFVAGAVALYRDGNVRCSTSTDLIGTLHTRSYLSEDVTSASLLKIHTQIQYYNMYSAYFDPRAQCQ